MQVYWALFLTCFICLISMIFGQEKNGQELINQVFRGSNNTFEELFEEITDKSPRGFGALTRCGEAEDEGVHRCVHYTKCHPKTREILSDNDAREVDGFGILDIR